MRPAFQFAVSPTILGLAERAVGNVKNIVSKLAMDHPKQWHTYLPIVSGSKRNMLRITIYIAKTSTLKWARRY